MAKVLSAGRGLRAMKNSMSKLEVQVKGLADLGTRRLDRKSLEWYITSSITKLVRASLLRSLRKSGVRRRSGSLEAAVAAAEVSIGKDKLKISLKPSLSNKLLRYASSVNYGAVRDAGGLGAKAKRTLKSAIMKDRALSERELRRFTKGVRQKHETRVIKKGTFHGMTEAEARKALEGKLGGKPNIGGTTIVLPKPYFYISASDKKLIAEKVMELYREYFNDVWGRKRAAGG